MTSIKVPIGDLMNLLADHHKIDFIESTEVNDALKVMDSLIGPYADLSHGSAKGGVINRCILPKSYDEHTLHYCDQPASVDNHTIQENGVLSLISEVDPINRTGG